VGAGLSFENFVLIGLYGLIFITVYVYRIIAEEKMLVRELGDEYSQYQKRSWKLFPLIY
jgi:protein-S-isoprenylcysteine O-methyltransferase Ste14